MARTRGRDAWAALAAASSGLMLWLASPAVGIGWLAWIALVPAAWVVIERAEGPWGRLAVPVAMLVFLELSLIPAFPPGLAEGQWGDPVLPVLAFDTPLIFVSLVAVPLFCAALWMIRFGRPWGARLVGDSYAWVVAVGLPALAFAALELVRVKLDPGALWGPVFLSQAAEPAGAIAAIGGPWLVTVAVVAVNYGIAWAIARRVAMPALVPAAIAALLAAGGWAAGQAALEDERAITVAAVQPGYDTAETERQVLRRFRTGTYALGARDVIADLAGPTLRAGAAGADLVVWPQAVMYVDPREEPRVARQLERLAEQAATQIVVPFFLPSPVREDYVTAVAPPGEGGLSAEARPKHRPLWFLGENRARGDSTPLTLAGVEAGMLLGVDTLDPGIAASLRRQGAQLIVSVTHDWRQSARQHRAFAALVARAAGAPLVRADWRYGSEVIAANGREVASAGDERGRELLVAEVSLAATQPPAARLGNLVGWIALVVSGLAGLWALAARRGIVGGRRATGAR